MSKHIVDTVDFKFVFGWDQPLMTFYFQKHDKNLVESDENPIVWKGIKYQEIYEVDDLVNIAKRNGYYIPHDMQVKLYGEKDEGV